MKPDREQREEETDLAAEIDRLISDLSSRDDGVGAHAFRRLVALGPLASTALVHALAAEPVGVRWRAATVLRRIADPATISALLEALEDEDIGVRWLAAEALAAMGMPALVALLECLIHRADSVLFREGATHVLVSHADGPLGPTVRGVLYSLEHQASDVSAPVAAYEALEDLRSGRFDVQSSSASSS